MLLAVQIISVLLSQKCGELSSFTRFRGFWMIAVLRLLFLLSVKCWAQRLAFREISAFFVKIKNLLKGSLKNEENCIYGRGDRADHSL